MATLRESPNGNVLNPQGKAWFEALYPNPPKNLERSIVFGKQDLRNIANQSDCAELVFSKQPTQNKPTLAVAGVKININNDRELLAGNADLMLISNLSQFPQPANAPISRSDFKINVLKRIQEDITFNFEMPLSTIQRLDNLIVRFRSFSGEPNSNFFLTATFQVEDLNSMFQNQACERIAFVPVFIKCIAEAQIDREGIPVTERSASFMETLAAMPMDDQNNLILTDPVTVTSDAWPLPYKRLV